MRLATGKEDQAVPGEWLSHALLLDPSAIPGGAACFADARALGLASAPILLGWRRSGGAVLIATSEDQATPDLLVAAQGLAESTSDWGDGRWGAAFGAFWAGADPTLRRALAERLPLPTANGWSLESWSAAVWGSFAGVVTPPAVAVVGSSLSDAVLAAVVALEGLTRVAAFTVQPLDESRQRIRCSLVAGVLDPAPERALPGDIDGPATIAASRALGPEELLSAVERLASGSGAKASWCRREWVRFEGPCGAIRAFPRGEGLWLQLAGADEGTRVGLWFRHGLVPGHSAGNPSDAPPGAHLFLRDADALTPSVRALLRHWLGEPSS